jgi:adenylate cyclase
MPVHPTAVGMERKLAAILSADVAGYSRLMGEDEEATIRTLTASREITDSLIHQHRGRVVNTAGDSVLAEFASAVDAVQCAVDIQQALKTKNGDLPPARQMAFRIGINVGDVVPQGEDLYGDGVNVAARLQALADAGGVFIAGTVYDQVKNKLALNYEYLGEQAVKNIADPVRVYRVVIKVPSPLVGEGQGEGAVGEAGKQQAEDSASQKAKGKGQKAKIEDHRTSFARRKWLTMTVIGLLHIAGVTGIILYRPFSSFRNPQPPIRTQEAQPPSLPLPDKPSIAVLPFVNRSGDAEQEHFSDGMTDTLITDLSTVSGLFVIARNSAFTYKGKAVKVDTVSKELGVRYVVEGSVQQAGDRVRINIQLIDATTGGHMWAERYDRVLQDIFALQDEISQKIVQALAVKLTQGEQTRLVRKETNNVEAYEAFWRGEDALWHRTQETNLHAQQLYERAIELDSQYAAAYAGLAHAVGLAVEWGWDRDPQTLDRAVELAQKALTLDASLPTAHHVLALAEVAKGQHDQAIAHLKQSLTLAPNDAYGYVCLAHVLSYAEQPQEAITVLEQAMRLNPQYPVGYLSLLGEAYAFAGRYEEAAATFKKALVRKPDFWFPYLWLAIIYTEGDRHAEARAAVAEALKINPQLSLETLAHRRILYKDPAIFERELTALRKAGLK